MPPKTQKAASGRGRGHEEQKTEPLQAVVLADTFETKFVPFTLERPRCLLPLANTPLIEYTLTYLARSGVQEVFVYAGSHVDQVEAYIDDSRWKAPSSPFRSLAFLRCAATSVGDVMRDLDSKHILGGDFIIVSGDILSDFPISHAMKKHKARREKDKNAIMTMLLRQVEPEYYQSTNAAVPTFAIDPTKDRCLHYEEASLGTSSNLHIEPEILKSPEIDIRQDLLDCRIDICTPDVLSLWSDNFDNQTPRRDFLFGVLKDWELNGKTIHTHVIEDYYAARVADLQSYVSLSDDMVLGMIPALVIQNNPISSTGYDKGRNGPTYDNGVIKARPVKIDERSVIASGTSIGSHSNIQSSIIGHRCHIGKRAKLTSSYLWDDVTIGSNVRILRAIIGSEAFIGDESTIGEGALISFGVKIAPGTTVPAGARITKADQVNSELHTNGDVDLGKGSEGHQYHDEEEDSSNLASGLLYRQPALADSVSTLSSDISEPTSPVNGSRSQSFATATSDDDQTDRFQHDTVAILVQRMQEGTKVDDMLSELMGLRFSGGADETQVRKAVARALGKRVTSQIEEGLSAADASRRTLKAYNTLVRRAQAEQTTQEQVEVLLDLQRELAKRTEGGKALLFMTKDLYDLEVLSEDSFTAWWSDSRSSSEQELLEVRAQTSPFIEWLENADSESDEEEDEDDD